MQTASASTRTPAVHPHYPISLSDLAQALDHSEEGFALTDPQGNYVYINDAHLCMYGYEKPQDLLGRSWRVLYTPEWVRHFEESVLPIIPRDLVWRGQVIGKKRDGFSFLAGVTLTLLPDGKITCNCRDETIARVPPDAPQTNRAAKTESNERASMRELGERIVAGLPAKFRRPLEMLTGYSSFFLDELQGGRTPGADSLRQGIAETGFVQSHAFVTNTQLVTLGPDFPADFHRIAGPRALKGIVEQFEHDAFQFREAQTDARVVDVRAKIRGPPHRGGFLFAGGGEVAWPVTAAAMALRDAIVF